MAELSELLAKMTATDKRQERQEQAQLDALGSLEKSFPQALAEKAEILVGEKKLFEHSEQLEQIRRGVDGMKLTLVQRFSDWFTNIGGRLPHRAARKRAYAADLATSLMRADIEDIAAVIGRGEKRAEVEERNKRRGLLGGLGGVFEDLGKTLGMFKKVGGGKAVQKARELASYQAKMLGYARVTAEATGELADQEPEEEGGKTPWKTIAVAGVIMIWTFFKEIGVQLKWMSKILGGGLKTLFAPLKLLFSGKAGAILMVGQRLRDSIGASIMAFGDTVSDYLNKKGLVA